MAPERPERRTTLAKGFPGPGEAMGSMNVETGETERERKVWSVLESAFKRSLLMAPI